MDNNRVLVLANPADRLLAMLEALPEDTQITVGDTVEAFRWSAAEADVIFGWPGSRALLREVLGMAPEVRWVHTRAAGLDDLMSPELVAHPAVLTNGTGVFSPSLGEFALGAILYFAKDFPRLLRNQKAGVWEQFDVPSLEGQTVGIVGYGDIGRAVAERVRAMGMRVLALKRHPAPSGAADPLVDGMYGPEQRCEMLAQCDFVVIAAPLTAETRGMMGEAEFAAMKRAAVLVNIGRGPIVNEAALIRALSQGLIHGAALDVFEQEPLPAGHPFYGMENVLLSPHSADHTPDWLERAMRFFLVQFERFRQGEPLANVVDKHLGY
jgi:phosphoglycerate dehydrogenase-like enzyme